MLNKHHDIPSELDKMSKYVSSPMYNPKGKKLVFYTHFRTILPLSEMKRDPLFMVWLKEQKIYISVMTIHTTDNVRVGLLLGKGPHITTVTKFTTWIQDRLKKHCTVCPAFQLNVEGIGRYKDTSTKSRAIILICSSKDVKSLRILLDAEFHSKSNFPFTPFHIMNSLHASTQTALYKAHKNWTLGNDLVEITIPNFQDLETKITIDSSTRSLRDVCFDLKDQSGKNVFVDIDQSPRSSATIKWTKTIKT